MVERSFTNNNRGDRKLSPHNTKAMIEPKELNRLFWIVVGSNLLFYIIILWIKH